jgi:hypothetical protein
MNLKTFLFLIGSASFAIVSACGGGDDMSHEAEPMEEAEPAPEPTAATFELGGGTAMEVHPGQAGSPHVKTDWTVGEAAISVTYGRPLLKGRVVGDDVEPMGDKVWRLGADEATTLTTDTDLMLGGTHVPAGEYTLFTQSMNDEFHLIVNSETGQWGTAYNADNDVAHVAMDVTELDPPAEQLTISIADGQLGFEWGQMAASVSLETH